MSEPTFEIVSKKPYTGVGTFVIENGVGSKDKFYASLHFITEMFLTTAHDDREPVTKYTTMIERNAVIEGEEKAYPVGQNTSAFKITVSKYQALASFE